ncbi:MAG: helix-turn-helix domain-containing protein [Acidobacteriota bacterium]
MSKAKQALAAMMDGLEAGAPPRWARKTVFQTLDDGSVLRRIIRENGEVEKEELISPDKCPHMAARARTGLSQSQFAALLGISVRTLHDWEQGRREPSGPAKTLLKIVSRHPEVLRDMVD